MTNGKLDRRIGNRQAKAIDYPAHHPYIIGRVPMSSVRPNLTRWAVLRQTVIGLSVAVSIGASVSPASAQSALLIRQVPGAALSTMDEKVIRQRRVSVPDGAQLEAAIRSEILELDLFPDVVIRAIRQRAQVSTHGLTWGGAIEGYPDSAAVFAAAEGELVGHVYLPFGFFNLQRSADGGYLIQQIDPDHGNREANDAISVADEPVVETSGESLPLADSGDTIDVLIAYTRQSIAGFGSEAKARAHLDLMVAEANQAFRTSRVNTQIRLVAAVPVDYPESGDTTTDLTRLRLTNDGFLDELLPLRDEHQADQVTLIVERTEPEFCGRAYQNSLNSTVATSFALVGRSCATSGAPFAHEIGHNLGAHHDWYESSSPGLSASSKGFVSLPGRFRDVMSYAGLCIDSGVTCSRLLQYSTPSVTSNGYLTGVPSGTSTQCTARVRADVDCDADAAAAIQLMAPVVARFRNSRLALSARRILPGAAIRSNSGRFRLTYQVDGNLVLYDDWARVALWASHTSGAPGEALVQADGNFVVFGADRRVVWESGTAGNENGYLIVQDDGNVVLFRADGQPIWAPSMTLPAPLPQPPTTPSPTALLQGSWRNTAIKDVFVTRAKIQPAGVFLAIDMWSSGCSQGECTWGRQLVPLSTVVRNSFSIEWNFSTFTETQTISLDGDGRLKLASRTHYKDNRSQDFDTVEYLRRE